MRSKILLQAAAAAVSILIGIIISKKLHIRKRFSWKELYLGPPYSNNFAVLSEGIYTTENELINEKFSTLKAILITT
jgi:hypothetical protein